MKRTVFLFCLLLALIYALISTDKYKDVVNLYHGGTLEEKIDIKKQQEQYKEIDKNLASITYSKELKINQTQCFNYLSKKDIYNIRKKYVSTSLFNTTGYEPSDAVFGQIEDRKPWYGMKYYNCTAHIHGTTAITLGDSEESRFVNNPDMLIGINAGGYDIKEYDTTPKCTDSRYTKDYKSLKYDPDTNTITAVYRRPAGGFFGFVGINARDFGYNYVTAISSKNIIFREKNNVTNSIYSFRDFLHTGGSCGVEGGCNNGSPYQSYLDFQLKDNITAEITFKLWRNNPNTRYDKGDINYKIIIYTYY